MPVALYTFGVLDTSASVEKLADFRERAALIYANAKSAAGYLGHAEKPKEIVGRAVPLGQDFGAWGAFAIPTKLPGAVAIEGTGCITTLSAWRDVASARAFVYGGDHRAALARRSDWFVKGRWPGSVLWRIDAGVTPTWSQGVERLESLAAHGDTAEHFTFGSEFCAPDSVEN